MLHPREQSTNKFGLGVSLSNEGSLRLEFPEFAIHGKLRPTLADKSCVVQIIIGQERKDGQGCRLGLFWELVSKEWQGCFVLSGRDLSLLSTRRWIKLDTHTRCSRCGSHWSHVVVTALHALSGTRSGMRMRRWIHVR